MGEDEGIVGAQSATHADTYQHDAEVAETHKEIVALVMDEESTTAERLVPMVIDVGKRRNSV